MIIVERVFVADFESKGNIYPKELMKNLAKSLTEEHHQQGGASNPIDKGPKADEIILFENPFYTKAYRAEEYIEAMDEQEQIASEMREMVNG